MQLKLLKQRYAWGGVFNFVVVLSAFLVSDCISIFYVRYQLHPLVLSAVISSILVFREKAILPSFLAFLSYHLITRLSVECYQFHVILFVTVIISLLFLQIKKRLNSYSILRQAWTYSVILGILYPLINTSVIIVFGLLHEEFHVTKDLVIYLLLEQILTQLTVTPLLIAFFSAFIKNKPYESLILDKLLRCSAKKTLSYYLWLLCCFLLIILAIQYPRSLVLYTASLILLVLVVIGIEKYAGIQPLFIWTLSIFIMLNDSQNEVINHSMLHDRFLGLLLILNIITVLGYFIVGYTIKHYELAQKQIVAERIDPYTGVFNLSQLEQDLSLNPKAVLIYLNLSPTLSRLSELGHNGKIQLITQLYNFFILNQDTNTKCYLPRFSTGIIQLLECDKNIKCSVAKMAQQLESFQFYWRDTSISLVSPTLHCVVIKRGQDVTEVISHLCEHQCSNQKINWIKNRSITEYQFDKLAFIQRVFTNNEFELYCQPYMKLTDPNSQQLSFEVLTRVKTLQDSCLLPSEFFPLINQFGLEIQLDQWVIENTFRLLSEQVRNWHHLEKCSVNLTTRSLAMTEFGEWIIEKARQYQVPLSKICFEVTESSALQNEEQTIDTLKQLRKIGCKIALDDFGSGYASFAYLRLLPLDIVKIDGQFIKDLLTNEIDKLIIESISNVANDLGLEVVAEFVESKQHIEILKQWNITYAQGFGVHKPKPLTQVLREFEPLYIV